MFIYEGFEDTKEVIIICKSKDRHRNGQMKKGKQACKQRTTKHYINIKDPASRTPLKSEDDELREGKQIMLH